MARPACDIVPTVSRRLPRAQRRDVLLRAATSVFGRRGYAAASMDQIAAAAGVTKLILYRHFGSKAAVYRAALQELAGRYAAAFRASPELDGFGVGARSLLGLARADPDGFQLLWRQAPHEAELARLIDRLRGHTVAAVRASVADRVPAAFREWAAHAVVGYLVEAVANWLRFGDPARDEAFARATNVALRAGVRSWAKVAPTGRRPRQARAAGPAAASNSGGRSPRVR